MQYYMMIKFVSILDWFVGETSDTFYTHITYITNTQFEILQFATAKYNQYHPNDSQ